MASDSVMIQIKVCGKLNVSRTYVDSARRSTLLQNVNHVTQRSNSDALVTTVLGAAVLGGVRERCPETPFRSSNAILREADVKETGAGTGEGIVLLLFIVGGVDYVN